MFTLTEIAAVTGGSIHGECQGNVSGVSTDSRTVRAGELFVPLRGERFDGHDFICQVAAKGVGAVLADENYSGELPASLPVIRVADSLRALGNLAAAHRRRFTLPMVAVTGSNGKTTTKEMLATIMEQTGPGLKTSGNLNNLIGLPQMLFKLDAGHLWAVLEMGMSEPGEIDRLAEIAAPQTGIVLNAFPAHLESMKSVEGVARAKGELLLRLPAGGCAIINRDDVLIARQPSSAGVRRVFFGLGDADVCATEIESLGTEGQRFQLHLDTGSFPVVLRSFGRHSVYNALAAAAAAYSLGIDPQLIQSGLERFRPFDKRFQLEQHEGLVLIDDSYNANPVSMEAALVTLGELKEGRRAFVALGDMLEMGSNEVQLHHSLGVQAARVADRLYLFGDLTAHTADGARSAGMDAANIIHTQLHDEIVADILEHAEAGDFVLVKGSRGMRMDRVSEGIRARKV
ncbi:MAG: UDP-N-acetylmuramoyl-tripeptide--D-alanyl-D-alanine ligase [Desulfuromonadales bacterium]|nr:UDP-N-acetylmuramoyl-tripeptide--D-alanyl-D-alanine ligase [Desulfuromonadales bacterium]